MPLSPAFWKFLARPKSETFAFGGIERTCRTGESLLGGDFDLSVRQARDVVELLGDFCREGKEFVYPCFHDAVNLSGGPQARQAPG